MTRSIFAAALALGLVQLVGGSAARAQDLPTPEFTPFTVAPTITNRDEVRAALIREYEAVLRDQGIGGRVNVWFHITVEGRAEHMQIAESSGLDALDAAALRVADAYEFTPAMNRDQRVAVWVSLPITFAIPVERAPRTR